MKVLIIGGGGREHALAWKTAQSRLVDQVWVAPGNAGTARENKVQNVAIQVTALDELVAFAKDQGVGLTIVGPEAPLVEGLSDRFKQAGLRCFGPSRPAARLEGSKVFTKEFLERHRIPTAGSQTFTEIEPAKDYVRQVGVPIVIKADGLAAGKGVIIARNNDEAFKALEEIMVKNAFGRAGERVIVEEFLQGEEVSFIVMVDGKHILPLATSQDHKARDNGDQGPNTGGMGAYSPAPVVTAQMHARIMQEIIEPTVAGMAREGHPYVGFLYAGLMIPEDGTPKVLEYNCRFGDPEAEPILIRLKSDLVELCLVALEERLHQVRVEWDPRAALGVVMAAGGYPEHYQKGDPISGLPEKETEAVKVFHAGTRLEGGQVLTNGGRVLCVTALGESVSMAQQRAYQTVQKIQWPQVYFRTDIGYRAVAREK
jgi:phosphoribosylamine--glycine ligase